MDPHSFIARAEAQRWLGIAEKLLMGRDLVGSKTFAIRARESDPRLEAADQILAVTDTLLAAEKRVGAGANQPDWYAILQLVRLTQDAELVATQYRRLSLLLNPHKNRLPYSDQAFQLINDAWSVLSNPIRKSLYDSEINFIPIGFIREPPPPQHHHQQQQHNFFSHPNSIGSSHEPERVHHNFLSQPIPIGPGPFQIRPHQPQPQPRPPPPPVQQPPPEQQPPPRPQPPQQEQPRQQQPPQQQQQGQQSQEGHATMQNPRQSNNGVREREEERETEMETETDTTPNGNGDDSSSFWTACPFCYNMYEYPRGYAECTLRCENCKRAFQAVIIPSPPQIVDGKEAYFWCWGFFPLGISMPHLEKNMGKGSSWAPFSPFYATTPQAGDVQDTLNVGAKKHPNVRRNTGPTIYIDDVADDVFEGIPDPSDDSDVEWGSSRRRKKVKRAKRKGSVRKKGKQVQAVKAKDVRVGNGENLQDGFAVQEGAVVPNVPVAETSKKAAGSNPRRQSGRVAKELGKLDLNVEFNNNDGEEPAPGMTAGNRGAHGEEDNIEGIGFFEGLDEFLSSLPILSVVGDDKVKAA